VVYGVVMAFWGALASGGGHFNLMMMAFVSPYGLGLLFWPLWGYAVATSPSKPLRVVFLLTMAAHCLGLLHYIFLTDNSDAYWYGIGVRGDPGFGAAVVATMAVYVAGHVFLWFRFLRLSRVGTLAPTP
jgi:hypothetical protein